MFPASKPRQRPNALPRSQGASDLMLVVQEAASGYAMVVAHPANEVDGGLRIDAALRAARRDDVEGRPPDAQELVALPEPASAIVAAEESLREELLANDSLGG